MNSIKLIHGDCLEEMDKLIEQEFKFDSIICDTPYGITACRLDSIIPFDKMWKRLNKLIKPNGAIVLFGAEPFSSALRISNIKNYKYDWYWNKKQGTGFLNCKKMPLKSIENISIFQESIRYNPQMRTGFKPYKCKQGHVGKNYGKVKENNISESNGDRYPLTLLEFKRDKNKQHPTQKPIALMEYLIKTYTNENNTVLDFTCGSGSTLIACKNTNRNCIGIEKDENYYNIAKKRLDNL